MQKTRVKNVDEIDKRTAANNNCPKKHLACQPQTLSHLYLFNESHLNILRTVQVFGVIIFVFSLDLFDCKFTN
jgi:hypothetical protein